MQFNQIVEDRTSECVHENGEWHIPEYMGIKTTFGTVNESGHETKRSAGDVQDAAQLTNLVSDGNRMVEDSNVAASRAMQLLVPARPVDLGHISRNPADQAASRCAPSNLSEDISRQVEIYGICYI